MSKKLKAEVSIEVPFYDLDPMNVVWHGNYIKYFEKARCELLKQLDFGYQQMSDSGFVWPVVDIQVKYVRSAVFGQWLTCSAEIVEYENRLKIKYEIVCQNSQQRLTKGTTVQVAVCIKDNELQLVSPTILLEKLGVTL